MRIFENTNYQFIPNRKYAYLVSGVLIFLSLASLAIRGLEFGIDFSGGMEFVVSSDEAYDVVQVRSALAQDLDGEPEVVAYDLGMVRIRTAAEGETAEIERAILTGLEREFPGSNPQIEQSDIVGPRFAADLRRGALYSVVFSLLVIFVYILIRFEWRSGVGSIVGLIHDVLITLGLFSLLSGILPFTLQMDQTIIAAFLTLIGYSLNDTVVLFDRVRESMTYYKSESFEVIVNKSVNDVLSRTAITSLTTLLVVVVLFIFGGDVLRGFAFVVGLGIIIGTLSTIFIASSVVIELRKKAAAKQTAA